MTIEKITELRDKIQELVDSHPEQLNDAFLGCDESIDDSEKIQKDYEAKINPCRQLHIGIVGRVKAGKSSLLNSLFFSGKDVLPKAATPMTAALTKLYYSEKLTVKINFFEREDIEELKKSYERYEKTLKEKESVKKNELIERFKKKNKKDPGAADLTEIEEKAKKRAVDEIKENNIVLSGQADQYKLYESSSASVKAMLGKPVTEYPSDISEIASKLADYVGANGKYTGITSNVEIGFPNEELKEITVVDTPGFDDPVPSRDALARDALKLCDAIFVLSPTGSFCNAEDKINITKIESGEGIQEVFIIASQIDSSLRAPEYLNNPIKENLESITHSISGTLSEMLHTMEREGVASDEIIKKLSESTGTNLLYTSGMCQSLYEMWDDKSSWDEELNYLMNDLKECYPSYFSSMDDSTKETLKLIGNIGAIKEKISDVRSRKDAILKSREDEFLGAKYDGIKAIAEALSNSIDLQYEKVSKTDIGALQDSQKKQRENLESLRAEMSESFSDCIDKFTGSVKQILTEDISERYGDTQKKSNDAKGNESKEVYYTIKVPRTTRVKKEGFGSGVQRFFGGILGQKDWGYENKTVYDNEQRSKMENVHTINAHEVTDAIKDFALFTGNDLEIATDEIKKIFKSDLKQCLLDIWQKYEVVEYQSTASRTAHAATIINLLPTVEFKLEWELPANLQRGGKLEGNAAYEFESTASNAMSDLRRTYLLKIDEYIGQVKKTLDPLDTANTILKKMEKDIEDLTQQIEEKERTLDTFKRIKNEIQEFKSAI